MTQDGQLARLEAEAEAEPGGVDVNGLLADLDVAQLRRFVLGVLRSGGVSWDKMAEVMRTSRASIGRDIQPAMNGSLLVVENIAD